ncbi:ArsR/SmtB family transcription factor [Demequina aestuarii]|uniref:ArsR/SmtB family transcription factor n=1 Tax=Demequina aestuarii TaxID=327095 RepID=UPI000A06F765|nr:metalloregulator ArsR/SmtB family transcription factor [Demequina aestuarii]
MTSAPSTTTVPTSPSEPRDHIACAAPAHTAAVAHVAHALSDPTRAAILLALRHGTHCPADLAAELSVSRQSMSNHLTCLRGCGLVTAERRGRHAHYSLAHPSLATALEAMLAMTVTLDPSCCDSEGCTC